MLEGSSFCGGLATNPNQKAPDNTCDMFGAQVAEAACYLPKRL